KISGKVFCADFMPAPNNPSLEERECGLDRIRVNVSAHVFASGVCNCVVLSISYCFWISRKIICIDHFNISRNVFLNVFRQCSRFGIFSVKEPQFPATLPDADNHFFFALIFLAPSMTHALLLSAYIGFVHFDCAVQHPALCGTHSLADSMEEIPCG